MALLTIALALDPNLDAARIAFAQAQSDLGHPDAAGAALAHIAPDSPYRPTANSMQAWLLYDGGEPDQAIALARSNAAQGGMLAQRALADLYRANENYSEAEPLYTAVINAQPEDARDWRLYFSRGACRERLGKLAESEADMRLALALSPDQSDVLNYLGYMLIDRTGRIAEGMTMIERAVALRPSSGAIVDSLGWAYFRQGQYQRALEYLERAVELEPADPTLNDHLGDVYWRVGRRIEARYQWRRALTFNAPTSDRPAIEAKLHRGLRAAQNIVRER
jgi:tetratricopeptide (TPR) repeat protein